MGDQNDEPKAAAPAWQAPQPPTATDETEPPKTEPPTTLNQARKFLQDPEVQKHPAEQKTEFLRTKGVSDADIETILREAAHEAQPEPPQTPAVISASNSVLEPRLEPPKPQPAEPKEDRPPIVTYPEFLTKPVRPPPLMTVNGFLNTLYGFGGLSALVYGTSKFVLEPMVQSLTDARVELHETAKTDLSKLIEKLEAVVSEIPATAKKQVEREDDDDDKSSYDDPTELFHRDIGVQTSFPSTPAEPAAQGLPATETAGQKQARQLAKLVASVKEVDDGMTGQTEAFDEVKTVLDVFREDVYKLTYSHLNLESAMYGNRSEPDDEIKKVKENIRRVKGVLLTTRSFPGSTR
ncbi:peroxisomal membrane anchor protein conserved region-domain-containing protein [Schizothecium vesticola]|uniref:Peroxisomal membrane protein PEX14 n=1 Tax=Schizothecium vesticola TaxID=314040 RepID=A0AA40JZ24_9PEZI|nr:peroxisomal membrane anchor protein conserved region-domain-containing protein [Schizothecium vesticola]